MFPLITEKPWQILGRVSIVETFRIVSSDREVFRATWHCVKKLAFDRDGRLSLRINRLSRNARVSVLENDRCGLLNAEFRIPRRPQATLAVAENARRRTRARSIDAGVFESNKL